jgi:hypothetical protein
MMLRRAGQISILLGFGFLDGFSNVWMDIQGYPDKN